MAIPVVESAAPRPAPAHGEYQLGEPHEPSPLAFRAAPARTSGNSDWAADRERGKKKAFGRTKRRREREEPAVSRSVILISLAALALMLTLLALFVPGTRKTVGVAVALPGLLLCVYGFVSGAYIAFTEDDLYGWLYVLFPFYAAYYFVSRWDEMRSRLVMVVVGLTLLAIGGRMLESDHVLEDTGKASGTL
jgi:hypothetical protein